MSFKQVTAQEVREGDVIVSPGSNAVRLMVRKIVRCPDGGVRMLTNGADQRMSPTAKVRVRVAH